MNPIRANVQNNPGNIEVLVKHPNEGYRRFRQALQEGRLEAGMTLTQNELCKLLDLSLSPLRETLVLLEEYGLVEIKPRAGIRIVYPEVSFIRENMQFRIMIEVYAMRAFVHMGSEEWLANMRTRHQEFRTMLLGSEKPNEAALSKFLALDQQMHRGIVEALDNRAIRDTHARVHDNVRMARRVHQTAAFANQLLDTVDEHLLILDAIEARNVEKSVVALEAHFRASTHRAFSAP